MSKSAMRRRRLSPAGVPALLIWLIFASLATGEVVQRKDGSKVEGTLKRTADGYDVTDDHGNVTHVTVDEVRGILLTTRPVGPLEAESRLLSLRRAVENVSDLPGIIDRYNHFIEANKGSSAARDAERDLAEWRERADKRMVKVGPDWVLPAERERLLTELPATAASARQLLAAGRARDADALIQRGLDVNPADPALLFLRGVLLYRQDQLQPARKAFDGVTATVRDHAPSLNNTAVILWRQNQAMGALNLYIQAMAAAPASRQVLDNVAEALNSLPANQRTNALAVRATKVFAQQDADLQRQMNAAGWYRWGSAWVSRAQFAKLEALEKEINAKLDQMSTDYDNVKAKVDRVDADVEDNVRRMRSIEQSSYAVDAQGNAFRLPLPQRYYDLDRENRQLAQDRAQYVANLDALRTAAKKLQQALPTPRFTGVQNLIGGEGTPGLPPPAGASPPPPGPVPAALTMPKEVLPAATAPTIPPLPAGVGVPTTRTTPAAPPSTSPASGPKVPASLLAPG